MNRTAAIDLALQRGLSSPRLGRYLVDSGGILDAALSLYERNARLAESFYRPLQALEVCLRNHMDARLVRQFGANWYANGGPQLDDETLEKIDKAVRDVKQSGKRVTPGAVVAELSFGFWVLLLSRRYDATLWRSQFSPVFTEAGRKMARQRVHNRMDELRKFRNRVAHHEPIYHLDPAQKHADLIQGIAWICPDSAAWAWEHSRVPYVLEKPWPAL